MTSPAEERLSQSLRSILAELPIDADIPEYSERFREVLCCLGHFIPEMISEIHPWFNALDDVFPVVARKTGEGAAELFGICCFIDDQKLTPLHVRVQVAVSGDEISWLECRFGERGPAGLAKNSYHERRSMAKRLQRLDGRVDLIDWFYKVTFGERRG